MSKKVVHASALAALTVAGLGSVQSTAGPRNSGTGSICDGLKPAQTVSEENQRSLDIAFRSVMQGGDAGGSSAATVKTVVLEDSALAQAYFTYQACLLKEAGMIDQATAQEIVRKLMGLEPAAAPAAPPAAAPAPVKEEEEEETQSAPPPPAAAPAPSGEGTLTVKAPNANGTTVLIDGVPSGKIVNGVFTGKVAAGSHSVSLKGLFLTKAARSAPPNTVNVSAGDNAEVVVSSADTSKWWLWTAVGVVGAVLLVSVGYYFY